MRIGDQVVGEAGFSQDPVEMLRVVPQVIDTAAMLLGLRQAARILGDLEGVCSIRSEVSVGLEYLRGAFVMILHPGQGTGA